MVRLLCCIPQKPLKHKSKESLSIRGIDRNNLTYCRHLYSVNSYLLVKISQIVGMQGGEGGGEGISGGDGGVVGGT